MKPVNLLIILLLLFLPFSASAGGTGSVKVIHINDDGSKTDITEDSRKEGDSISSDSSKKNADVTDSPTISDATGYDAFSDSVTKGGINIGYRIGDEFLKGGFKIASVDIDEKSVTGTNTMTYSLYSKKLNPFAEESVRRSVIITYAFHIAVAISIIFLGVVRYVGQVIAPKKTTKMMAGFSGEYTQFDIVCFIILCAGVILMPIFDMLGISFCILVRNVVAGFMETKTLDIIGTSTESLPTYVIVNAAWYLNNIEKILGEYAILTMCRLIVIKTWIQAVIVLVGALSKASMLQAFVMGGFILVLSMDIITLFFVSSGISDSITKDNIWYAFSGMITATTVDALILLSIIAIPVTIIYAKIRSGRIGGRV